MAILLRVTLAYNNWPYFNSDEGTLALMARHILWNGEHPLVYYGQDYMGTLEAYLGAFFYIFLGSSVFSYRLGMVVLYVGFLLSVYAIVRQLYTKNFALFSVALFSVGSAAMLSRQLAGIGGYGELNFLAALAFALALRLALTSDTTVRKGRLWRHLGFFMWSVAIGVGIWSHTAILPWVACSGLLLLLFCWREMIFKGTIFSWLAGLLVGGIPLILYNLRAQPHHDTISVLMRFVGHEPLTWSTVSMQIANTLSVSLPIATGSPICYRDEIPSLYYYGFVSGYPAGCSAAGYIWSVCFTLLACAAIVIGIIALIRSILSWRTKHQLVFADRRMLVWSCAHLLLTVGVLGIIFSFLRSGQSLGAVGTSARYMLGTWVGLAAVIWPLWNGMLAIKAHSSHLLSNVVLLRRAFCFTCLTFVLLIFAYGSFLTVVQIPQARTSAQTEQQDVQTLLDHGVTHVYGYYWFCYRLSFYSNERLICSNTLFNDQKQALYYSHNKYLPYQFEVEKDLYASYVVKNDDIQVNRYIKQQLAMQHVRYTVFSIADNVVYQPLDPVKHAIV